MASFLEGRANSGSLHFPSPASYLVLWAKKRRSSHNARLSLLVRCPSCGIREEDPRPIESHCCAITLGPFQLLCPVFSGLHHYIHRARHWNMSGHTPETSKSPSNFILCEQSSQTYRLTGPPNGWRDVSQGCLKAFFHQISHKKVF